MHTRPSLASALPIRPLLKPRDGVYREYCEHSSALRINTDEVIAEAVRKQYPELQLTITSNCALLSYAAAGHATATPIDSDGPAPENLKYRGYVSSARRRDGDTGFLYDGYSFGKFLYKWEEEEYILYTVDGSNGPYISSSYFLLGTAKSNDRLLLEVFKYQNDTHDTVLVFDGGYWEASRELWRSVQDANWDDVILEERMKKSIIGEVNKFFNSEERYKKLKVPWKRGIIFHGPPGNGKTISIKAMMHSLYDRDDPTPTLYVRSLTSFAGPEYSISQIFGQARLQAPCFLVFEDLDSIVTDNVRSYFLNEVDGLKDNDGILMVGSTNHLERLDPGISKRPSRFDRKYLFPQPDLEQRVQYCEFWRKKLQDNEDIEFPEKLNKAIASITEGFSFAYIQEAFVAALLAIANAGEDKDGFEDSRSGGVTAEEPYMCSGPPSGPCTTLLCGPCKRNTTCICWREKSFRNLQGADKDLDQYVLWREIKKVIKALREELEQEKGQ